MKTKILSLLVILCLGLNFTSCSKDEEGKTDYESGKQTGAKFYNAYESSKNSDLLSAQGVAAIKTMSECYAEYKNNSGNSQWKSGFLAGATNSDNAALYPELEEILNSDFTEIENILPMLKTLLN